MSFDINTFLQTAEEIYQTAASQGRLIANPPEDQLRQLVTQEEGVTVSAYGNICVDSEPTSRAAMFTQNNLDSQFGEKESALLRNCLTQLSQKQLVSIDLMVGDGTLGITARVIVPKCFVHLIYAGLNQFGQSRGVTKPTHTIIFFTDGVW